MRASNHWHNFHIGWTLSLIKIFFKYNFAWTLYLKLLRISKVHSFFACCRLGLVLKLVVWMQHYTITQSLISVTCFNEVKMTESTLNYSKLERDWKVGGDRKRQTWCRLDSNHKHVHYHCAMATTSWLLGMKYHCSFLTLRANCWAKTSLPARYVALRPVTASVTITRRERPRYTKKI